MIDDLELDRQQEERTAKGAVDNERDRVGRTELSRSKDHEREHRTGASRLDDHENRPDQRRSDERDQHCDIAPSARRTLDQAIGESAQGQHREHGSHHVGAAGDGGIAGLRHMACGQRQHPSGDRQVDEEHPSPRGRSNQVAADQRTGGSCQSP